MDIDGCQRLSLSVPSIVHFTSFESRNSCQQTDEVAWEWETSIDQGSTYVDRWDVDPYHEYANVYAAWACLQHGIIMLMMHHCERRATVDWDENREYEEELNESERHVPRAIEHDVSSTLNSQEDAFGLSRFCIDLTLIFSLVIFIDTINNQIIGTDIIRFETIVILIRIDNAVESNQRELFLTMSLICRQERSIDLLPEYLAKRAENRYRVHGYHRVDQISWSVQSRVQRQSPSNYRRHWTFRYDWRVFFDFISTYVCVYLVL